MKNLRLSSIVAAGTIAASLPGAGMVTPVAAAPVAVGMGLENVVADNNQTQVIDVFDGINAFRATKGLKALKFSVPISAVSQDWSNTLAANDDFYHNPDYVSGAPQGWGAASEIIAARWDRVGQGLVNQWINSPGHNAVMSTDYYNTIGIGIAFTDMSQPAEPNTYRFGMYGTANLFTYDATPPQTYNHPRDYFEGKPPLPSAPTIKTVTPSAPTFSDTEYTLPDVEGVQYQVNGSNKTPGTYAAPAGENVDVVITAAPLPGYAFETGAVSRWEARMRVPSTISVSAAAPTFDAASGTYTIPFSGAGVSYQVNGQLKGPGEYLGAGTVVVTALPAPGYALSGVTSWTFTFPAQPIPSPVFTDVPPTAQFSAEIGWMASTGISTGWAEADGTRTYRPLASVNRDAMAAFMYRLAGKPEFTPPAVSPFTDVPTGGQFYKEITWLAAQGISSGWDEPNGTKTYRPLTSVNRDAMAAFMYRLAKKPAFAPPAVSPFTDVAAGSQFYKEITWLAAQGISTGWSEPNGTKTYRPLTSVNRDAMAAFMHRFDARFQAA